MPWTTTRPRGSTRSPATATPCCAGRAGSAPPVDAVFRALAGGHEPPRAALDELLRRGADAAARGRLVAREGGFVLAWAGDDLERPLWPLAAAAVDLLRSGPLDRLKQCADCPWLFLDTSRNRSRRWCSMDDCGARAKMRTYRARRATAGR